MAGAQPSGERVGRKPGGAKVFAHHRKDLRRREAFGSRVVSDLISGPYLVCRRRVRADAEAVARLVRAVENEPRPRGVFLDQPRLIEERDLERPCRVEDERLYQWTHPSAANWPRADRTNLNDNSGLLARCQCRNRARFTPVARQVLEQRTNRDESKVFRPFLGLATAKRRTLGERLLGRPAQRSAN
ncbi:unannotated protein [freshwater metagenome]|uniref:Unannotated protein n=1 Tax=freshwater metagenome TaxID=449393 RepID=A0A6J7S5J3_9ZZZZ